MFTGIVEGTGTVAALAAAADDSGARLEVEAPWLAGQLEPGESVAVNGCCVTVAGIGPGWFTVALVPHTLEVTTLGDRQPGDPVQLEVDVVAKYVERLVVPMRAGAHERSVVGRVRR